MNPEYEIFRSRIRARLNELRTEPLNYRQGIPGTRAELPNNLMMLHRHPGRKIFEQETRNLYHPRYVLTINLHTSGMVNVNGKSFAFPECYAHLTYPYQTHFYLVDQNDFDWLVITFEAQKSLPPTLMYRSVRIDEVLFPVMERLLMLYLKCEAGTAPEGSASILQVYLELFLGELALEKEFVEAETPADYRNDAFRLFEEINNYIYAHLTEPDLSIRKIARVHYVSPVKLHRLFNRHAASTPGHYIRECRLQKAVRMLGSGTSLVSEVAEQCGFDSLAAFSRCFKREFGISPSEFQKRQNNAGSGREDGARGGT